MRALFIGGTGILSSACTELAIQQGWELTMLRRGVSTTHPVPPGVKTIHGDIHGPVDSIRAQLGDVRFDVVVDFIAFTTADIERDIALFRGRTNQFLFISSASAYQKPPRHYVITEQTPLENPFWEYSRNKIACEARLMRAYQEEKFPAVIIRPSHTYSAANLPFPVDSSAHPFTMVRRMRQGKRIIVPGDGTSLWTLTWHGDFAKGLVGLMGRADAVGEAFHITSDEALTWNQIIQEVGRAAGTKANLIHIPSDWLAAYDPEMTGTLIGDKANCAVFDNTKIKRFVPNYSAEVVWAEGARRVVAWLDADPARQTVDAVADQTWDAMIARYEIGWPKGAQ
jgi:nucleoside-diphosphate-sugar epimerase